MSSSRVLRQRKGIGNIDVPIYVCDQNCGETFDRLYLINYHRKAVHGLPPGTADSLRMAEPELTQETGE